MSDELMGRLARANPVHVHEFVRRWRCEHVEANHSAVCQRGRWVHVCNCGEPGFEKRGGGPDNERSAGGDGRLGEGNSDTEGGHGEGAAPALATGGST